MKDYYLILGIEPNATLEEIKKAYREMSLKYHPDKNKGDKYFEERFKDIKEAYDILTDNTSRQTYDYEWLKFFKEKKEEKSKYKSNSNSISKTEDLVTGTQTKSAVKQKRSFNKLLLFLVIVLMIYIGYSENRNMSKTELSTRRIEELTKDNDKKLAEINFLTTEYDKLNQAKSHLIGQNKKGFLKTEKIKNVPFDNSGLNSLSNKTFVKNEKEIIITRIEWDSDPFEGKRKISSISVLNNMTMVLFDLKLFYEVMNSQGQKVDAGEVILFKGFDKKGVRQPYNLSGRQVYANSAVQSSPDSWIQKKDSEYIVISIKSYDTY